VRLGKGRKGRREKDGKQRKNDSKGERILSKQKSTACRLIEDNGSDRTWTQKSGTPGKKTRREDYARVTGGDR